MMYRSYSNFIYHGSKLHFSVSGEGKKILLMFHGFGQTHKSLRLLEDSLCHEYKIYSFDLFFHGFSEWNHNDTPLSADFWRRMMEAFFEEYEVNEFDLLGFSLGAKVCLSTFLLFPKKVSHLYLIAPDGIKTSWVYKYSTWKPFRGLFRNLILQPQLFQTLIKWLERFRMANKSALRFASIQMNSKEKRRRIYYTWTVYKGLKPNIPHVIKQLNEHRVFCDIYAGRYDRLIPQKPLRSFESKLSKVRFHLLESGHNNLVELVSNDLLKESSKK